MADQDFFIAQQANWTSTGAMTQKPINLIVMGNSYKGDQLSYFLAIKLEDHPTYVSATGYEIGQTVVDSLIDAKKTNEYVGALPKETLWELRIPWNRIARIRNLTYRSK